MEIAGNVALSRMIALRQQMDIAANNIANMNTTGFKSEALLMREDKIQPTATGLNPIYKNPVSMVDDWGSVRDTRPGVIKQTGNPLDVAIEGAGYFAVTNANGEDRFTRNGVFQINADGQLVDLEGQTVQGDGGEITVPAGTTNIAIGKDGTVSTATGIIGKLRVASFENEQALLPDGNNGFKAPEGIAAETAENPRVIQGAVEQSNVNGIVEMTEMVEVLRQYQSAQNIMQSEHDRLRNSIRTIAKLG
jgi:flagellar basal-body rod protein FlgF